jgi:hypothetical protein
MPRYRRRYDELGAVPNTETWGRHAADHVAKGYGKLQYRDNGGEFPNFNTAVGNEVQNVGSGDSGQGYYEKGGKTEHGARAYYHNDVAQDSWLRGGSKSGVESAMGKPNFDPMKHPAPVSAHTGDGDYTPGEQPSGYHAHDDNGRTGGGRGKVTEYNPVEKSFWAPQRGEG